MSHFDAVARDWDKNQMHTLRSKAVAGAILESIPVSKTWKALEYGAGTAFLSIELKDKLGEITLMDNSREMVQVSKENIAREGITHMKPLFYDLEKDDFNQHFDFIYNQMVLHHVNEVGDILQKFYKMLNRYGYLAIADLYTEDGSFHGPDTDVKKGFDINELIIQLQTIGFVDIDHKQCFVINKTFEDGSEKSYPVFLIWGRKG